MVTLQDNETPIIKNKNTNRTPVLDMYSTDLTKMVKENKLDPVIGRDNEVERIGQVLSRKKKNNVIIVGDSGVGKTSIAEKLAQNIVNGDCALNLYNKRIVALNIIQIVAGTKFRGQFEERMIAIMNELENNKEVIVFIDEIHMIAGAGDGGDTNDLANILKPALAKGTFQCIGATTFDDYKRYLERDSALTRRFQRLDVHEPSVEDMVLILKGVKKHYEKYHNVKYSDEVINKIVLLAKKYITNRHFPDKGIDVMDELGTINSSKKLPSELYSYINKINEIKDAKIISTKQQKYELAANYRDEEKKLSLEFEYKKDEWLANHSDTQYDIQISEVYDVVSKISKIPIKKIDTEEKHKLLNLADDLKRDIINQDHAIEVIVKGIKRNKIGVKETNRPIGVYLCVGTTGVGKTYLAKKLSENIFGDENKIIRLDMSEYTEKHTTSKIIGAPPGYVGYNDGGQLTERVKNNPFSVVLLDEVEKAHPVIFDLFLQILDEGRLTDSFGRNIDFTNTLIIMTSNVGTKKVDDFGGGIGFKNNDEIEAYKKSTLDKTLKNSFRPEFLNRIDDIIYFNKLDDNALNKIIILELNKLSNRLKSLDYITSFDDSIVIKIMNENKNQNYGARPIKRLIQNICEDFISDEILKDTLKKNKPYLLYYDDEKVKFKAVWSGKKKSMGNIPVTNS